MSVHPYPALARRALEFYLAGNEPPENLPLTINADPELWSPRRACFVTIKKANGDLRGCIGAIWPVQPGLGAEIMSNAISAATRDPRFPAMELGELAGATLSVDVLSPPEPVRGLEELDPARWGVIVEKNGRRGLLLPDLEGVDSVEAQIRIAAQKAGIRDLGGVSLQRFSVARYPEKEDGR